jgi:hypothetical protein
MKLFMKKRFKTAFQFNSSKDSTLSSVGIFVFIIIQLLLHSKDLRISIWQGMHLDRFLN